MERMDRRWSIIPCERIEELARQLAAGGNTASWMTTPNDPDIVECLKDRAFTLLLDNGAVMVLDFSDPEKLAWAWNGEGQPSCEYGVACAPGMPDIIFLHYYCAGEALSQVHGADFGLGDRLLHSYCGTLGPDSRKSS